MPDDRQSGGSYYGGQRRSESIFEDDRDRPEHENRSFFRGARDEGSSRFRDEEDDDRRSEARFERDRFRAVRGQPEFSGGSGGAYGSVGGAGRDYGMRVRGEERRPPQTIRNEPSSGRRQGQYLGEGEFFSRAQSRPPQIRSSGEYGARSFEPNQDEQYRSWRRQQLAELDRDYDEYCRERQQEFNQDFEGWRQTRQSRASQSGIQTPEGTLTLGAHQAAAAAGGTAAEQDSSGGEPAGTASAATQTGPGSKSGGSSRSS